MPPKSKKRQLQVRTIPWYRDKNNGWLFKFAPGILLGAIVGAWLRGAASPRDDDDAAPRRAPPPDAVEEETDDDEEESSAGTAPLKSDEEVKMMLCVNTALKMGTGKIGAQCAHAAVGAVMALQGPKGRARLRQWEECGQAKICLKVTDTDELKSLAMTARSAGLPFYVVRDAGRTQVEPGSMTVLAIGPAAKSQLDKVTGHLKLL